MSVTYSGVIFSQKTHKATQYMGYSRVSAPSCVNASTPKVKSFCVGGGRRLCFQAIGQTDSSHDVVGSGVLCLLSSALKWNSHKPLKKEAEVTTSQPERAEKHTCEKQITSVLAPFQLCVCVCVYLCVFYTHTSPCTSPYTLCMVQPKPPSSTTTRTMMTTAGSPQPSRKKSR